jgi:prolyl-tRNA synthetase
MFLRTAEFLWQEGHTAHATQEEAIAETKQMLEVYANFAENYMAMPVLKGVKSPNERFAGAIDTYCIEAMMQDKKALQAGTSHFLGQNFAKAFDVKFLSKENKLEYVWATSWGVSTRLMGALIMSHSDDNGLVLPPKLAPIQVAIVPIFKTEEECEKINAEVARIQSELKAKGISVKFDDRREYKPGWKFSEYEFKGVPVRLTMGARDLAEGKCEIARRDTLEKQTIAVEDAVATIERLLEEIQENLFLKAKTFREENTRKADTWEEFVNILENEGGFISAHWDGTPETEEKIKELTKATIRCIPFDAVEEEGKCILTGKPSNKRVIFAKAY